MELAQHQTNINQSWTANQMIRKLVNLQQSIDHRLENQITNPYRWAEDIVAQASPGVCLIQGEYMFVDPQTEMPLRYADLSLRHQDQRSLVAPLENEALPPAFGDDFNPSETALNVSVTGAGPLLRVQFTGTGFLIDGRGYILTNRHVTEPWRISQEYQHVLAAGYQGRMCLFRAFFADQVEPYPLEVTAYSEQNDLALLHGKGLAGAVEVLPCATDPNCLKAGQTVIVLGYPTGFDALLARLEDDQLAELIGTDGSVSFDQLARKMARLGLISPIGTRGMCGKVSPHKILYDAQTAIGGSGGPVVGPDGRVVAINTALLKGFAGTNFGIPIAGGLELLEQVTTNQPQVTTNQNQAATSQHQAATDQHLGAANRRQVTNDRQISEKPRILRK